MEIQEKLNQNFDQVRVNYLYTIVLGAKPIRTRGIHLWTQLSQGCLPDVSVLPFICCLGQYRGRATTLYLVTLPPVTTYVGVNTGVVTLI